MISDHARLRNDRSPTTEAIQHSNPIAPPGGLSTQHPGGRVHGATPRLVPSVYYPWTPYFAGDAENPLDIRIHPGVVNGVTFPTNAATAFTLTDDQATYFWLESTLVSGSLTSCAYDSGTSLPAQQTPSAGSYPTAIYQGLFKITTAAGAIKWNTVEQYVRAPLSVLTYPYNLSGNDVTYRSLVLAGFAT